jgi:hypothetical protein
MIAAGHDILRRGGKFDLSGHSFRLATIVTPRWGFVLQLVLRRVEANKVRASILAKLATLINESGLYSLILSSKLPSAKVVVRIHPPL